jgi:hypothetical protein
MPPVPGDLDIGVLMTKAGDAEVHFSQASSTHTRVAFNRGRLQNKQQMMLLHLSVVEE